MGAQVVDYRVSTLVVLCKDCGHDVGLYPARHKCLPVERPAMPALPTKYQKSTTLSSLDLNARTISSGSTSSSNISSSPSPSFSSAEQQPSKWSSRLGGNKSSVTQHDDDHHGEGEDSIYFNNFASNLPENHDQQPSGKKLWGKVKQNEKWKQLSEKNEKPKPSGKLWGKLMQATQNMADKIPSRDDRGADSDEDDWEGETHVSRILREYYEKKRMRLPEWLFDDDTPMVSRKKSYSATRTKDEMLTSTENAPMRTPSRRRLWEQNPDDPKNISSRERERQELRQAQPPPAATRNDRYSNEDRYSNNRNEDRYDDGYRSQDRYRDEGRYSGNRNDDHHYRNEDRYRDDGRYSNHNDHYNNNRGDDRYNDNNRYHDDYRDPRVDHRQPPPPSSRYNDHHNPVDNYYQQCPQSPPYQQRPQSPPYQQQRSKSTSRTRYYDEEEPPRSAPRGGYQQQQAPSPQSLRTANNHHYDRGNDMDDYYYNNDNRGRRDPSNAGRRYGNDPNYF